MSDPREEFPSVALLVHEAVALIAAHEDPEHRYLTAREAAGRLMGDITARLRHDHGRVFDAAVDEWQERTRPQAAHHPLGSAVERRQRIAKFRADLFNGNIRSRLRDERLADIAIEYGVVTSTANGIVSDDKMRLAAESHGGRRFDDQ